ncbi:MAG: hypothetical protein Q9169_008409 [Polycauliona sp. 2 TL-2023]
MVLDTSSLPSSSDAYDSSPSTPDPYDGLTSPSSSFSSIDTTQLPHPPPLIGPLFGYTKTYLSTFASIRLNYHSQAINRPLTAQEREAITFHAYKSATIASIGTPIAFSYGIYRAYSTREKYRFPLYGNLKKEGGWWDGERLRIMGNTVSEGANARFWVHVVRGSAYAAWAMFLGGLVVNSYATTVAAVGEMRDPRLRAYADVIKEKAKQRSGDVSGAGAGMKTQSRGKVDPTGQGDKDFSELWKRHRRGIGAEGEGDDDASPSKGNGDDGYGYGYGGEAERLGGMGSNTGIMSDTQMRAQETRQQPPPTDSPTSNRASTFRVDKSDKQPRTNLDKTTSDDDASPSDEGIMGFGGDHPQNQNVGGSWERIRRQAATGAIQKKAMRWNPVRKEEREGKGERGDGGDDGGFSFLSEDEERVLAKDEAQNEFDKKVERERQGGSFDEGRRGKRW